MRWLLLVLACLGAIALFLLATASANTELFAKQIDLLLVVNGVLGALLVAVVGAQLWQLWRKRRSGAFGYRLAVRLVLVFALVPRFGARGAAIASTLSYALIFCLVAFQFRASTAASFGGGFARGSLRG